MEIPALVCVLRNSFECSSSIIYKGSSSFMVKRFFARLKLLRMEGKLVQNGEEVDIFYIYFFSKTTDSLHGLK